MVPISRIRTIYDTVPDVLPLSPDGAAALSMAVECFADDLLKKVRVSMFTFSILLCLTLPRNYLNTMLDVFPGWLISMVRVRFFCTSVLCGLVMNIVDI